MTLVKKQDDMTDFCAELDRCNQRGGRMLSVLDLLDAGTLPLDWAAYLVAKMWRGTSFMAGARPGGAGKTTVMCALVGFWPQGVRIAASTPDVVAAASAMETGSGLGILCHEIGQGPYFAYLWGARLRDYCALSDTGVLLATNLHADDLDEAMYQVCGENGVPEAHFRAFRLLVFLSVENAGGRYVRRVSRLYETDGSTRHKLIYDGGEPSRPPVDSSTAVCRRFLARYQEKREREIAAVRRAFIEEQISQAVSK